MNGYPLCDRTVTVYRCDGKQVQHQVVEGCWYEYSDHLLPDGLGNRLERKFLLILPGAPQRVFPGDRIYPGVGPEITPAQWSSFLPVNVPGLMQAEYAKPWYVDGKLVHTEAGRK